MSTNKDHILDHEPAARAGSLSQLAQAAQALSRAFRTMSMYVPGHPSTLAAVKQATELFEQLLTDRHQLIIEVSREHLICDRKKISENSKELQDLALMLHQLDIAKVEFQTGFTDDELQTWLTALAHARQENLSGDHLLGVLAENSLKRICIHIIDYQGLDFTDGADQDRDPDSSAEDTWANMTQLLTQTDLTCSDDMFDELAEEVYQQTQTYEGVGASLLREKMHHILQTLHRQPPELRNIIRDRIAKLIAGLNSDLRQDLLRVTAHQPDQSLDLMIELADKLPVEDLLAALQRLDGQGGRLPQELLQLVQKLNGICQDRPNETHQFHDMLQQWGLDPQTLALDNLNSEQAVQELFQDNSTSEFSSEDYRRQLAGLSDAKPRTATTLTEPHWRHAFDPQNIRCHAAEIATELLIRPDGQKQRPSLFAYVGQATESLLDTGRILAVHQAAEFAQRHCAHQSDHQDTRAAAHGYLDNLKNPNNVDAMFTHASQSENPAPEDLDLLGIAGQTARALALARRADQGWTALQALLPILDHFPTGQTISLLETLLDHEQSSVRHGVLNVLWQIDTRPTSIDPYLRRALAAGNLRIEIAAVQRLAQWPTDQALNSLAAYIEGGLSDNAPPVHHCRRAAELILKRGPAGLDHLCSILETLCRKPSRAKWAKLLADILSNPNYADQATPALKTWKLSPARMTCFLLNALKFLKVQK